MSETLRLNGKDVAIVPGESVLELSRRVDVEIPTLCHDPRLKPVGACRTCLVEIDGMHRLVPSCATKAAAGMAIDTNSERVVRHQKALFALYLSDNVDAAETDDTSAPSELHAFASKVGAPTTWPKMQHKRFQRAGDRNPYIEYRADRCILCARCTRYCEEVESVSAITLAARGSETTIATSDNRSLLDTTCELCGGCVDVCPTGAMAEKKPLSLSLLPARELEKVRTTCNYCGVGCQMDLNIDRMANDGRGVVAKITSPDAGVLPNDGNLCVKGRFAYQFIDHADRLTKPLVRGEDGELAESSWEDALRIASEGLKRVAARHGADSLSFVSSSRCTGEENYLVQKLSRAVFGTNNVHQCAAT
ncbi:MAG: molybdopterin-dependent oxidoreductase [Myxococcales bacterium]|nr:molybdopterin-dependent oxidoreductase [Myxococcales bacterium]